MRKLLGGAIDADAYRLTIDLESDVARVRAFSTEERFERRSSTTRGRCCPAPRRPASSASAMSSSLRVRQAVMSADDREALWAWVQCPSGRRRPARLEATAHATRLPRRASHPRRRASPVAAHRVRRRLTASRRPIRCTVKSAACSGSGELFTQRPCARPPLLIEERERTFPRKRQPYSCAWTSRWTWRR